MNNAVVAIVFEAQALSRGGYTECVYCADETDLHGPSLLCSFLKKSPFVAVVVTAFQWQVSHEKTTQEK